MIRWEKIPENVERERTEGRKKLLTEVSGIGSRGVSTPEDKGLIRASARRLRMIADELDTLTPLDVPKKEEYKSQGPPGEDQGITTHPWFQKP